MTEELKPGEYLDRTMIVAYKTLLEKNQRIKELEAKIGELVGVLNHIASWREKPSVMKDGSLNYSGFDEPDSAKRARDILTKHPDDLTKHPDDCWSCRALERHEKENKCD